MNNLAWIGLALLATVPAAAQEKSETSPRSARTPLRADVVLSRYQGEKKISTRPYSVSFASGPGRAFTLRQGNEVPVAVSTTDKEGRDVTSFQYRNVGVNMEFSAEALDGGRYLLQTAVEDSSLLEDRNVTAGSQRTLNVPVFQTRNVRGQAVLRDGETVTSSMTDPVTGDVTKVDVTLHVQK
jgi:Flp pilus assembly secretin CpaC